MGNLDVSKLGRRFVDEKGRPSKNKPSLVQILSSSPLKDGALKIVAFGVDEVTPGRYKSNGEDYEFIVKRSKIIETGRMEDFFHITPESIVYYEHDSKGRSVALYPDKANHSIDKPFYTFE